MRIAGALPALRRSYGQVLDVPLDRDGADAVDIRLALNSLDFVVSVHHMDGNASKGSAVMHL